MGSFDRIFLSAYNRKHNVPLSDVQEEETGSLLLKERIAKDRADFQDDSARREDQNENNTIAERNGAITEETLETYPDTIPIRPFGRAAREQAVFRSDAAHSITPQPHFGRIGKRNGTDSPFKIVDHEDSADQEDEKFESSPSECRCGDLQKETVVYSHDPEEESAAIIPLTQYCTAIDEEEMSQKHSGITLGDFPLFLRDLPHEAERELYGLGEYLYEKLLDGHKVLGFMGTKNAAGCSTLILAVAGEILRKGLSLLIVDTHTEGSDILSFLDHPDRISLPETKDLRRKILKISVPAAAEAQWKQDDLYSGPFLYFLQGSSLMESERSEEEESDPDHKESLDQKIRSVADDFDIVLIDAGSCENLSDDHILQNMMRVGEDGFFVVRDVREKDNDRIRDLAEKGRAVRIPCLGIVENFV
ncbi:MAG: hypothetical protein Q4G69_03020 [Planctomycetia bacterium]|nr:hypothetical protein [Planctomycetia bacterium]